MARIPEAELESLKREISVERLVEAKGVKLKRHGQDLIGLCPFHDDREPSLVVSPQKNLWHCLGACQQGGSVIDWVMKAEGVSFRHAVELLREDSPALVAETKPRGGRPPNDGRTYAKSSSVRRLDSPVERGAAHEIALRQVIDFYHETLKQSPEALAYLQARGLASSEMVDRFELGYANRTLGYRLPDKTRRAGAELRTTLQEVGVLRPSGHEHFSGSLVVPVFGEGGRVLEVYGRKIGKRLRKGTPQHLYLPGPHRGVWNLEAFTASKEVILCESLLDALTFWCAGYRNVTSSYGVEGFTDDHLAAMKAHGTERVLLAYDRDEAGDSAAAKLAERLMGEGLECFRVQFPRNEDANGYALAVKSAPQSLGVALRGAVWLGKGAPKQPRSGNAPRPAVGEAANHERTARLTPEAPPASSPPSPAVSSSLAAEESAPGPNPFGPSSPSSPAPVSSAPTAAPSSCASPPSSPAAPAAPVAPVAPATPAAPTAPSDVEPTIEGGEVVFHFGPRRWRVRGLAKNTDPGQLRVNLLCSLGDAFHVDTFDLYSARHRTAFLKQATEELDDPDAGEKVLKKDLGRVLLKLEELQEQAADETRDEVPEMTREEREEAEALLASPDLLDRILADFERCGVVGEQTNKLVGYLAATSRMLAEPLAIIIQSSSAAGKSALMNAVLALMPEEQRVQYYVEPDVMWSWARMAA